MSRVRSRALLLSAIVAILAAATPSTASAATIRRAWTATISGAVGVSGTATLDRYWAGNGSFSTRIQGLRPSTRYAVTVYRCTCSKPVLLLRLPNLATDANGTGADAAGSITPAVMAPVWRTGESRSIALRLRAGRTCTARR